MKKSFLMLIILFICGLVSADICMDLLKGKDVLLNLEVYKTYANAGLVFKEVFWSVLYERIKLFGLILLLCVTPLKAHLSIIFISIFSFVWGFYVMSAIGALGLAGVVIGFSSVLPQGIFYAGILFLLFRKKQVHSYQKKEKVLTTGVECLFMLLLFVTGCVVESLVSTHFIPWVIRLSLI